MAELKRSDCFYMFSFNHQIPLDMSTLTDAEKKIRIEARKPKTVIKVEDAYKDTFDRKKYLRFIKK